METKYLSDGRKVAVLGKLNNQETIVQEVFVTESGDEIPSGERFVVKSLHEAPVQTWKAKEEQRLEARITAIKDSIDKQEREAQEIQNKLRAYRDLLKSVSAFSELVREDELEVFTAFLSGSIEYLVFEEHEIKPPVPFIDAIIDLGSWGGGRRYEGLKLLSVAGRSNGDLTYWLHRYSDGSGSYTTVHPCTSYQEAVDKIKRMAIEKIGSKRGLSKKEYDVCTSLGISFPADSQKAYIASRVQQLNKQIEGISSARLKADEQIIEAREELERLNSALGEK